MSADKASWKTSAANVIPAGRSLTSDFGPAPVKTRVEPAGGAAPVQFAGSDQTALPPCPVQAKVVAPYTVKAKLPVEVAWGQASLNPTAIAASKLVAAPVWTKPPDPPPPPKPAPAAPPPAAPTPTA